MGNGNALIIDIGEFISKPSESRPADFILSEAKPAGQREESVVLILVVLVGELLLI